jgi:hypothetical protein
VRAGNDAETAPRLQGDNEHNAAAGALMRGERPIAEREPRLAAAPFSALRRGTAKPGYTAPSKEGA